METDFANMTTEELRKLAILANNEADKRENQEKSKKWAIAMDALFDYVHQYGLTMLLRDGQLDFDCGVSKEAFDSVFNNYGPGTIDDDYLFQAWGGQLV